MRGHSQGLVAELRRRIRLSELIGRRVKLVRRGREFVGLCPFHSEKTPSFYVVDAKRFFHCFGCGVHGDAIAFVMQAENLGYAEAVEKLAAEARLAGAKATAAPRASSDPRPRPAAVAEGFHCCGPGNVSRATKLGSSAAAKRVRVSAMPPAAPA